MQLKRSQAPLQISGEPNPSRREQEADEVQRSALRFRLPCSGFHLLEDDAIPVRDSVDIFVIWSDSETAPTTEPVDRSATREGKRKIPQATEAESTALPSISTRLGS